MPNKTIGQRIDGFLGIGRAGGLAVSELIGRTVVGSVQASLIKSRAQVRTVDETIPDYEFYDWLRRGKAHNYTLGSLFAKRIEHIYASWTMGDGVGVQLAEGGDTDEPTDPRTYTDGQLADFLKREATTLLTVERDKYGLGDQYIVVNHDGTLSVPSPDTVEVIRSPIDYRAWEAVEITTKLDQITIVDRYEEFARTITTIENDGSRTELQFENLLGRIPVVHAQFGMSANETNGHSVHEQLVPLYDQYDETVFKQLDGAKLLGSPMLSIEGLEDTEGVVNLHEPQDTAQYMDENGNIVDQQQIKIDENAVLMIGKGGTARFVAPPTGFTADTAQALKTLFIMLLEHTGIPEFVWGTQISSGRSSTEVQMVQWTKDVQALRLFNEKWIMDLCELWLAAAALVDARIVIDAMAVAWPELTEQDAAQLLQELKFAAEEGLLTRQAMLELLDLVEDAAQAVQEAEDELDARQEKEFPADAGGAPGTFEGQLGTAERAARER